MELRGWPEGGGLAAKVSFVGYVKPLLIRLMQNLV